MCEKCTCDACVSSSGDDVCVIFVCWPWYVFSFHFCTSATVSIVLGDGADADVGAMVSEKAVIGATFIIGAVVLCSAAAGAVCSVGMKDFSLGYLAYGLCSISFVGGVLEEVGLVLPLDSAPRCCEPFIPTARTIREEPGTS